MLAWLKPMICGAPMLIDNMAARASNWQANSKTCHSLSWLLWQGCQAPLGSPRH